MDVSAFKPLEWVEREGESCKTEFVKQCEEKRENVCADVSETVCDVVPYTGQWSLEIICIIPWSFDHCQSAPWGWRSSNTARHIWRPSCLWNRPARHPPRLFLTSRR